MQDQVIFKKVEFGVNRHFSRSAICNRSAKYRGVFVIQIIFQQHTCRFYVQGNKESRRLIFNLISTLITMETGSRIRSVCILEYID